MSPDPPKTPEPPRGTAPATPPDARPPAPDFFRPGEAFFEPRAPGLLARASAAIGAFVLGAPATFWHAWLRLGLLAAILYSRLPTTNYIFDEQEALLANPYVNATDGLGYLDAIHRDFWGLPPDRSVGSYRPLPNLLWRALWQVSKAPFFHHIYNVLFHALNAALLVVLTFALTRRRRFAWLAGAVFVTAAILTEAVSGIVGIADVLGGLGALLAIAALFLPGWAMPWGVGLAVLFGLFAKESALVCVPLVPLAALVFAPFTHPERPRRALRCALALAGAAAAFALYVELRKVWFPSPLPAELTVPLAETATRGERLARDFLIWFHQAPLPRDPLNNPLADAPTPLRVAGALRVYLRGLGQLVFPAVLSGDYSYPQEPVPDAPISFESVAGAAMLVLPLAASVALWVGACLRERRDRRARGGEAPPIGPARAALPAIAAFLGGVAIAAAAVDHWLFRPRGQTASLLGLPWYAFAGPATALALGLACEVGRGRPSPDAPGAEVPLGRAALALAAVGLTWVVVSYFPHSNIPVALPTVRAERFWYFPAIGSSLVLAALFDALIERPRSRAGREIALGFVVAFLGFQSAQAYRHAMDYRDDLAFWEATKDAVPRSAKAHLNYSVMKGARGDLETRLAESLRSIELAPSWPMAHVYTGDTLCRMKRVEEAWPHYERGFELGPNELHLIALALQCLWDEGKLRDHEAELRGLVESQGGTWIAYLAADTLDNGDKHGGVDPKYRPRGYNEGPKDEGQGEASASAEASGDASDADAGAGDDAGSDGAAVEAERLDAGAAGDASDR
jgi:tetratricopeptide (TPR) repeat protein